MEKKKYNIIYADPPWRFQTYSEKGKGRSAERHYPTVTIEDICLFSVDEIAADDCVLFLWTTMPCLVEAFKVIHAWGFVYKTTAFVWVKKNRQSDSLFWGMGYWTRSNAEICLLATRGNPHRISANVHQIVMTPIERHSKKPDEVRNRIVALMGNLPRIELFARELAQGWDAWGNEVESTVEIKCKGGIT